MGEILDQAAPAENLKFETYRIRALLSSPGSGAGKTTSACTLPDTQYYAGLVPEPRPLLLIDIDNRAEAIAGWAGVKILKCPEPDAEKPIVWTRLTKVKLELWAEARKFYRDKTPFPYAGIIVDGNTSLFRVCMNYCLTIANAKGEVDGGFGGTPAKYHYGPQMQKCADWTNSLLGLPCHVIFTGHENFLEGEGGGLACWLPKVTGKLATEVPRWFNETYLCYGVTSKDEKTGGVRSKFFWSMERSRKRAYLKSTMNQLQRHWSGPIEIDFDKEFVGFKDLLARRFGKEHFALKT